MCETILGEILERRIALALSLLPLAYTSDFALRRFEPSLGSFLSSCVNRGDPFRFNKVKVHSKPHDHNPSLPMIFPRRTLCMHSGIRSGLVPLFLLSIQLVQFFSFWFDYGLVFLLWAIF